jgi:cell division protein FtsQ|tara:strand:- start:486 stop:1163 length:678 start_codon:yes stop_codon:yes gene_type:complete
MHQSIGKKNKVALYLIFLILLSTTSEKFLKQQKKYSFKIDKITVAGLSDIKNQEIQNDLDSIFYQNIFILKKKKIQNIITKHNIIEEYSIKKIYPSTLNIEIKPTKFLAKVNDSNELIVGSNGKLISTKQNSNTLPNLYGVFNSKEFLEFKIKIEKSKFNFTEFKTIYFFSSSRWDILTIDDILIKLPQNNVSEALDIAYKIKTSTEFKNKNIMDLRIKNQLIVK